jgi:hypothetical protein
MEASSKFYSACGVLEIFGDALIGIPYSLIPKPVYLFMYSHRAPGNCNLARLSEPRLGMILQVFTITRLAQHIPL